MLSAEHTALEDQVVRRVLHIRQKEIDHFLDRYNTVITSSSLLAGFTVSSVTQVHAGQLHGDDFLEVLYFSSCITTLVSSLWAIIVSVGLSVFGPSLALRGPGGSVSRAYWMLRKQNSRVYLAQMISVCSFSVFIGTVFYIQDPDFNQDNASTRFHPEHTRAIVCMSLMIVGCLAALFYLFHLKKNFDFIETGSLDPSTMLVAKNMNDLSPTTKPFQSFGKRTAGASIELEESLLKEDGTADVGLRMPRPSFGFCMEGYLELQGRRAAAIFGGSGFGKLFWKKAYVVLQGVHMYVFKDKDAYISSCRQLDINHTDRLLLNSADEVKKISLHGSEVMIDAKKGEFALVPLDRRELAGVTSRVRTFRAPSQQETKDWVSALVGTSLTTPEY